ncbi:DUF5518 domain-containing protein [Halohasta litchfieldiae]|uniref:DUF5518 domain-containing protein n=1 Tax=Halohasta litchfieldiae TaxID=1073996 RepID=UPI001FE09779|nr:DUF5518 domain-containing protein [Halohasta litchfieldiae]
MERQKRDILSVTENWKYSLPGGVLAAIFVALSYGDSKPSLSLGAVFFIGIVVGFLSKRQYGSGKGTGALTGLIGSVPVVWILGQMLTATSGLSGPAWFTAAGTIMTVFIAFCIGVFGFALSALIGEAGARIGDAITESNPHPQRRQNNRS